MMPASLPSCALQVFVRTFAPPYCSRSTYSRTGANRVSPSLQMPPPMQQCRLEGIDAVSQTAAEVSDVFIDNLLADRVACTHSVERCTAVYIVKVSVDQFPDGALLVWIGKHSLFCADDQARCGGIALPASVASAGTMTPLNTMTVWPISPAQKLEPE